MRVALVCPYDLGRHGGVQDQVVKLAAWLGEAGHQSTIIGPGRSGPDDAVLLGPTLAVPANRSKAAVGIDPRMTRALRRAVDGADVIHIHEPFIPLVGPAALRLPGAKVVTLHADPSPVIRRLYRTARPLVQRALRRSVVTAVSPVAASVVDHDLPVRLVPNGIDAARFASADGRNPHRVVFVGRDEPRKGLDVLLDAWDDVLAVVPDAELVVIGAEKPSRRIQGGVRFLGRVGEDEKRRTLGGSGVLCAPNTGGESFGIVLVEAMAAGCAVVASGLPGFVHVLGDSGIIVAPGDPEDLAAALGRLLTNEEELATLGQRSLERVRRFDRDIVLAGYLEAYRTAADT